MKKLFVSGVLVLLSALSVSSSFAAKASVAELCGEEDMIFSAQDIGHKLQVDVCLEDDDTIYFVLDSAESKNSNTDKYDLVFEGNPRNTSWIDNSTDLTTASLLKFTNKPSKEKYVISAGKNSEGKVYGFLHLYVGGKSPIKIALDPKTIKSHILELEDTNFPETE